MSHDPPLLPVRRYRVPICGDEAHPARSAGFRVSINFGSEIRFESRIGRPHLVTFARHGLLLLPGRFAGALRLPEGHAYGPRGDGQRLFSKLLLMEFDNAIFESAASALQWAEGALESVGPLALVMDGTALRLAEAMRAELAGHGQPDLLAPIAEAMARWVLLHRDRAIPPMDVPQPRGKSVGLPQIRDVLMAHVLARIDAELGQKLSLQCLADGAGMSRSHFVRAFKLSTGLTPHQHLLRARIDRARHLMQTAVDAGRAVPLVQVAHDAGFASHSHFSAAFRAHVGVSPSDWLAGARVHRRSNG